MTNPLLSRQNFFTTLKTTVQNYEQNQQNFAVILMGINRFKKVNTMYGFEIGDIILEKITERVIAILPEGNFVSRLGDCKFCILLTHINHIGQVILAANKLLSLLNDPFLQGSQSIQIKANIGISTSNSTPVKAVDDYIHHAEMALSLAKKNYTDYVIYSNEITEDFKKKVDLESKISQALEEGEFELYYQPKVNLHSGLPTGAEALIRWHHSELGEISPSLFIPIAEQTGQIIPLIFWTLNTALRQLNEWPTMPYPLHIAVNFSAIATEDDDLVEKIESALKIWGVDYPLLTVEITESTLLANPTKTFEVLKRLKDLGIKISIDDFGTGYSSLSYFKNIPATELKIDQSFVSKVLNSPPDLQITKTIIAIAKEFGLQVVAEGIEDQATYDALTALGCDVGQGFFIGRPMPINKFVDWLNNFNSPDKPSL